MRSLVGDLRYQSLGVARSAWDDLTEADPLRTAEKITSLMFIHDALLSKYDALPNRRLSIYHLTNPLFWAIKIPVYVVSNLGSRLLQAIFLLAAISTIMGFAYYLLQG